MNLKVDLSQLVTNKKKYSMIYVDLNSLKNVSDVIAYICHLFKLETCNKRKKRQYQYSLYDGEWYIHPGQPSLVLANINGIIRLSKCDDAEDHTELIQLALPNEKKKDKTKTDDEDILPSYSADHIELIQLTLPTEKKKDKTKTASNSYLSDRLECEFSENEIVTELPLRKKKKAREIIETNLKSSKKTKIRHSVTESVSELKGNYTKNEINNENNLSYEKMEIQHTYEDSSFFCLPDEPIAKRRRKHSNKLKKDYTYPENEKPRKLAKLNDINTQFKTKLMKQFSGSHKIFDLSDEDNASLQPNNTCDDKLVLDCPKKNKSLATTSLHLKVNDVNSEAIEDFEERDIEESSFKSSSKAKSSSSKSRPHKSNKLNLDPESPPKELTLRKLCPPLSMQETEIIAPDVKLKFEKLLQLQQMATVTEFKMNKCYSANHPPYNEYNSLPLAFSSRKPRNISGNTFDFMGTESLSKPSRVQNIFQTSYDAGTAEEQDANKPSFVGAKPLKRKSRRQYQSVGTILNSLKDKYSAKNDASNIEQAPRFSDVKHKRSPNLKLAAVTSAITGIEKIGKDNPSPGDSSLTTLTENVSNEKQPMEINSNTFKNIDILETKTEILKSEIEYEPNEEIKKSSDAVKGKDVKIIASEGIETIFSELEVVMKKEDILCKNIDILETKTEILKSEIEYEPNKEIKKSADALKGKDVKIIASEGSETIFSELEVVMKKEDILCKKEEVSEEANKLDLKEVRNEESVVFENKNFKSENEKSEEDNKSVSPDIPMVDLEADYSKLSNISYESFPILPTLPKVGDIIACKFPSLDASMCPCYSDYRPARVLWVKNLNVELFFLDGKSIESLGGQATTDSSIEVDWRDVKCPRLVFP